MKRKWFSCAWKANDRKLYCSWGRRGEQEWKVKNMNSSSLSSATANWFLFPNLGLPQQVGRQCCCPRATDQQCAGTWTGGRENGIQIPRSCPTQQRCPHQPCYAIAQIPASKFSATRHGHLQHHLGHCCNRAEPALLTARSALMISTPTLLIYPALQSDHSTCFELGMLN